MFVAKRVRGKLALVFALTSAAFAHAVLLEATPGANSAIAGPDVDVQLRFNSRIDAGRSRLTVVLPDKSVRALALESQSSPATLTSRATGLASGSHILRWQVLAADGHISRGEVPFAVR
jgi:methionine-rich copper-binding protein CopC